MPLEFDDVSLRVIGNNVRSIQFYDDARVLQQEIYLQGDNTLNIGDTEEGDGGGGGMSAHALDGSMHVGSLASSQAPQFLLTDGGRDLTGNLSVAAGVTIDGVDISAHAGRHTDGGGDAVDHDGLTNFVGNEHIDHTAVSISAGGILTGGGTIAANRTISLAHGDVDHDQTLHFVGNEHIDHTSVSISAGGILSGGGTIAANRTISLAHGDVDHDQTLHFVGNEHIDHTGVILTAGGGLTGGGTIAASRTFAVGAGDGIVVAADSVAVDLVTAWSGLEFSSGDLRVDLDAVFTWTALHTFNAGIDVDGTLEFQGAESITTTAGNLMLAPAGDVVLNLTGNDVLPGSGYDINLGALTNKYLTLHAAELWVETLVAQDTIATIGGRILVGPTTMLSADLGDGVGDTTITVKHNQMSSGDRVVMQANGKLEWMAITSAAGGGAGAYTYSVTRDLDGTGRNLWYAGDAVFNTGTTGDGFIDLYSVAGVTAGSTAGPTIVGNVRNSATYNDYTESWAIGNLNGVYGYGVDTYGVGLGKYGTSHLTIDPTDGIKFYSGATVTGEWQPGGDFVLGQVATDKANLFWDQSAGRLNFRGSTNGTVVQAYVDTDGYIAAGAGAVTLGSNGLRIAIGTVFDDVRSISFTSGGSVVSSLGAYLSGGVNYIRTRAGSVAGNNSQNFIITAAPDTYWASAGCLSQSGGYIMALAVVADSDATVKRHIETQNEIGAIKAYFNGDDGHLRLEGGLYVGSVTTDPGADDIWLDGDLYVGDDIISKGDTNTYIDLTGTADQMAFYCGGVKMLDLVEGATDYVNVARGLLYVNETSCADSSQGVVINQSANDNGAIVLKSSDIAHGITSIAETDTYCMLQKASGTVGGLTIRAMSESIIGLANQTFVTSASTVKTTSAQAATMFYNYYKSGTSYGSFPANANIVAYSCRKGGATQTIAIWDEDGDYFYQGTLVAYDDYNDALVVRDAAQVLAGKWNSALEYNKDALAKMKIVTLENDGSIGMISHKRMTALMMGAIGQLYERCQRYELALDRAGLLPKVA